MITRPLVATSYFLKFLYLRSRKKSSESEQVICDAVAHLGGVYVKLLQFLVFQPNVFTDKQRVRFLTFFDQVPTDDTNVVNVLQKELSQDKRALFESIDTTPFAGGSFGQVYKAFLKDGTAVVVKVKRKGLSRKVWFDLLFIGILAKGFVLFFPQKLVDVDSMITSFKKVTRQELDYEKEVENALFFYDVYKDNPMVVVPKTYKELSSKNIIVQEYVEGVCLTDILVLRAKGENVYDWLEKYYQTDLKKLLPEISFNIWIESYVHDKFYADAHPGNIKILKNNRYGIIDFGIIGETTGDKNAHLEMMSHLARTWREWDPELLSRHMLIFAGGGFLSHVENVEAHLGMGQEQNISNLMIKEYAKHIQVIKEKFGKVEDEGRNDYMGMMTDMMRAGGIFGTKARGTLFSGLRNSSIFKAWVEFLDPDFHFSKYNMNRTVEFFKDKKFTPFQEKEHSMEDSLEYVLDWFGSLAETDRKTFAKVEFALKGQGLVQ